MFTILIHSSKTMRTDVAASAKSMPRFITEATGLARYIVGLSEPALASAMEVSPKLAHETHGLMASWSPHGGGAAIDTFTGDIYSGLQAHGLTAEDRDYAQESLVILSGLYGMLRPLDAVRPYRCEIGYRFTDPPYENLYRFWGDRLARELPADRTIVNVSSAEYVKAVFPYLDGVRIVTPKFLSVSPKTGEPIFVTVHAKIARGAFARWLIVNRIDSEARFEDFSELGYEYDAARSSELEPVYVVQQFKGLGLSVRLT